MEERLRTVLKLALLAGTAAIFLSLFLATDIASYLRPDRVSLWLEQSGAWAPFAYMAVMALVVVTPLPSLPLNFAAGVYFGPLLGTLYSVAGATGGAIVSFLLARFLGRDLVERFLKGHILFCRDCSNMLLAKIVFLGRLIPVVSFDMISYGAGLTAMSLGSFVLANLLGMLPLTFVYNYFGSAITIGKWWSVALSVVFMVLFFLLPWWMEKYDLFSLRRLAGHHRANTEDQADRKNA